MAEYKLEKNENDLVRCNWCRFDELLLEYHDKEWGIPVHDDPKHFELLVLESAQSGLSWLIILRKREGYRRAFEGFDPKKIADYDSQKILQLLDDTGIIRNRKKIESAVANAKAFLKVQEEFESFDRYIWSFVDGVPVINHFEVLSEVPAVSDLSIAISKDLRSRGFSFLGAVTVYSYLQSAGIVNDHTESCSFKYR